MEQEQDVPVFVAQEDRLITITQRIDHFEIAVPNKAPVLSLGIQAAIRDAKALDSNYQLETIKGEIIFCPEVVSRKKQATLFKTGTGLTASFHIL